MTFLRRRGFRWMFILDERSQLTAERHGEGGRT
jgi:hypothetical protein